jgi:hypothetical protein
MLGIQDRLDHLRVMRVSLDFTKQLLAPRGVQPAPLIARRVGLGARAEPVVLVILGSQVTPRLGRVAHVATGITRYLAQQTASNVPHIARQFQVQPVPYRNVSARVDITGILPHLFPK